MLTVHLMLQMYHILKRMHSDCKMVSTPVGAKKVVRTSVQIPWIPIGSSLKPGTEHEQNDVLMLKWSISILNNNIIFDNSNLFILNFMSSALNTFRAHALNTLFLKCSLQFQIVFNTVRMHALETLFSKKTLQFQILSNSVRMRYFHKDFCGSE